MVDVAELARRTDAAIAFLESPDGQQAIYDALMESDRPLSPKEISEITGEKLSPDGYYLPSLTNEDECSAGDLSRRQKKRQTLMMLSGLQRLKVFLCLSR